MAARENVFLFVPNIIGVCIASHDRNNGLYMNDYLYAGYVRVACSIGSCYYMPTAPHSAAFLYFLGNIVLDELDRTTARWLNQGRERKIYSIMVRLRSFLNLIVATRFGEALDVITDRYI